MALYALTTGTHSTTSGSFMPIPGLSLTLPGGAGGSMLVILNLPNPFAVGNNFPGATFGISAGGTMSPVTACFTSGFQKVPTTGRVPTHAGRQHPLDRRHPDHHRDVVQRARQHGDHRHRGDSLCDVRLIYCV